MDRWTRRLSWSGFGERSEGKQVGHVPTCCGPLKICMRSPLGSLLGFALLNPTYELH